MKKRVLSLFLALTLCLTLLPTSAFADGENSGISSSETTNVEGGQTTAAGVPVEDGNSSNTGAAGEGNGQPANPAPTTEGGGQLTNAGEDEQPNSESGTRTEIWCKSKPDSIGRGYDGTTDGSTIKLLLTFTDGTNEFEFKEGTDFTAVKTFDSADAGNHTVTVEITLIGEAATKYKLRAGEEKFEIGGYINKAYPKLTVSISKTTCAVGEKLLPLLSLSGVKEDAAVTYCYTQYKQTISDPDMESHNTKIDENTVIDKLDEEGNNTYYVYAKTAATKNYKAGMSNVVELTVAEKVDPVASVTASNGTETTYGSFSDAWTAAIASEGSTLKLLADGTLPGKATDNTDLDKSLTLNLNGYVLGSNGSLTVKSGAALTVKNAGGEKSEKPVKVGLYLTLLVEKGGSFSCTDGSIRYLGLQDAGTGDYSIKLADGESHCTFGGFAQGNANATVGDLLKATPGMALHADDSGSDVQVARSTLISKGFNYFSFYVGPCSEHQIGADGTCIYCGAAYVASVTTGGGETTNYTSLDDALDAAQDGDTVTLQGDAEVTKAHWLRKSFTLELNGKTATIQSGAQLSICAQSIIQDSSDGQNGKMVCDDYGTYILNVQGGELTIKSGTFAGKITAPAGGKSKLTIEGGTFKKDVNLGAVSASLSGGTFARIWCPNSFLNLLADGFAFYDKDNKLVNAAKIDNNLYNASVGTHQHSFTDGACGCGYTCPHTSVGADGKCTVCNKQFAASVTVDGAVTYYDVFYKALQNTRTGCTLKLLTDVTGTTVMINNPFIFDLNGHNVDALSADAKVTIKDSGTTKGKIDTLSIHNDTAPDADAPTPTIVLGDLVTGGDSFKNGDTWLTAAQLFEMSATDVSVAATGITGVTANAPESVIYGQTGTTPITLTVTPTDIETLTYEWFELKDNDEWSQITGAGGDAYHPANLNVGSHTIRCAVKSTTGYVLSDAVTVTVEKADIAGASVSLDQSTFVYDGTAKTPIVSEVTLNGQTKLTAGTDYSVNVTDQTNVGTYTVTVTGTGNYTGSKTADWTINPHTVQIPNITKEMVTKVYDGTADLDSSKLTTLDFPSAVDDRKIMTLTQNTDFTLTGYYDNKNADMDKSVTIIVTLKNGNYTFKDSQEQDIATYTFTMPYASITKAAAPTDIQNGTLNVVNGTTLEYTYDAKQLLPNAPKGTTYGTVFYAGEPSSDFETGYTVDSCKVGINSGVLTLTIDAQNGEKTGKIGSVTIYVTTDNYETISMPVDLYAVDKIAPVADGDITASEITYGQTLSESQITGKMKDPTTGDEVKGTFAWKDSEVKPNAGDYDAEWTFTPAEGYEEYAPATGTATVKVDRAQQYGKPSMAGYTYGETPSTPTLTERMGDLNASVTYSYCSAEGGSAQTWDINDPPKLSAGTYRMSASISQTDNYYGYDTTYCEFVVAKATPAYTKPTGLTAKYGQTLADVTLPDGWSWMDSTESVGDASTDAKKFKAKFTPTGIDNYNVVENIELEVTVNQADGGNFKTVDLTQKYTDTSEHTYTPDWSELPNGQKWSYSSEYRVSESSNAKLTKHDFAADGSLLTYAVSGGKAGDKITVTLKASCNNYEDFTITLNITLTEKNDQKALVITGADSVVYGQTLTLTTTGGSGTGTVTYHIDTATSTGEATIDPNTGVLTPVKVGSVSVIATKAGDNDYNDVTSAPFVLMVKPATPTGAPSYTKITTGGKTLADAALTTKDSTLKPNAGTLEWVDDKGNVLSGNTVVEANTAYKWRFTPTDSNYTTLTGEIELYHKSSSSGGGGWHGSYCTIKATAGTGGSISPSGNVSVREGKDQTFTITPDKGYAVSNVKIDGKSIGAVKSYTFKNVTGDHTIDVIFVKGTASANTGDSGNLPLWSALLLASTLTLTGTIRYKKKRAR